MKCLTYILLAGLILAVAFLATALRRQKRETRLEIQQFRERQKTSEMVIDSLLQNRVNSIRRLSDAYYYWSEEAIYLREKKNGRELKEDVIEEFRRSLAQFRDDPSLMAEIENALDHSRGQLMQRLRFQASLTPGLELKERDIHLLVLFFSRASTKSISFLLDMTEDAVRTRKSRYKKLFSTHGEAFSEFLQHLN